MPALLLDGKYVAQLTEANLTERVAKLKERTGDRTPVLATILVGDDPASATYVKMKANACKRIGMESLAIELPSTIKTNDLLREIEQLNINPDVHGILLQHPVPSHINERAAFDMIALDKDVDGVTCLGFGVPEHMWVTADQLVADAIGDRIEIKPLLFSSDLGVQHHLQEKVAEFFLEVLVISLTDGISHFVGLFQHVGHQ